MVGVIRAYEHIPNWQQLFKESEPSIKKVPEQPTGDFNKKLTKSPFIAHNNLTSIYRVSKT